MTSTNNNSNIKKSLLETIQPLSIPNLIAILGISIFIPGFIIVNAYLFDYGIHNYSLFRIKYLSAGFIFMVIFVIYFSIALQSVYYCDEKFDKIFITLCPDKNSTFWAIFSMIRVSTDSIFRHFVAVLVISLMFFPGKLLHDKGATTSTIVIAVFFFLIIYFNVTPNLYQRLPKIMYSLSSIFHLLTPFLFFFFLLTTENLKLLLMFMGVTFAFVLTLFQKKKIKYYDISDYLWIMLFIILTSASFGKLLYGYINPEFGGGKQVPIKLIIDKKNKPLFQEISIKVNNNISEKVFLLLQTDNECYIIKNKNSKNNKNEKAIQINNKIILGIIFLNNDTSRKKIKTK